MLVLAPSPTDQPVPGWLDAEVFTQAAAATLAGSDAAQCLAALDLYAGDYLPDDIYRDWAAARREDLRQHYLRVLLRLADLAGATGQAEQALRAVRAVEPTHEAAAQRLMETRRPLVGGAVTPCTSMRPWPRRYGRI